jgi:hypothetical protein
MPLSPFRFDFADRDNCRPAHNRWLSAFARLLHSQHSGEHRLENTIERLTTGHAIQSRPLHEGRLWASKQVQILFESATR